MQKRTNFILRRYEMIKNKFRLFREKDEKMFNINELLASSKPIEESEHCQNQFDRLLKIIEK